MKKAKLKKTEKDELRAEYKHADFHGVFTRGKYAKRMCRSSNVVVLKPEVSEVFTNEKAVNAALMSLIKLAQQSAYQIKPALKRAKKLHAG